MKPSTLSPASAASLGSSPRNKLQHGFREVDLRSKSTEEPFLDSRCGFKSHDCAHSHNTADKWTNLATMGEGISSGSSNFYWGISIANLISSFCSLEETPPALFWGFGASLTILAFGSMYAHRKLNIYHQHTHAHANIDEHSVLDVEHAHGHHKIDIHSDLISSELPKAPLHAGQKIALCADFISHTGDVCGPLTAGVDAMTKAMSVTLPLWGKALVQAGATLLGTATAVANVRSCKHAIIEQNVM